MPSRTFPYLPLPFLPYLPIPPQSSYLPIPSHAFPHLAMPSHASVTASPSMTIMDSILLCFHFYLFGSVCSNFLFFSFFFHFAFTFTSNFTFAFTIITRKGNSNYHGAFPEDEIPDIRDLERAFYKTNYLKRTRNYIGEQMAVVRQNTVTGILPR